MRSARSIALPRPRQVPQVLQHRAQVADADGHGGMVGAVGGLVDAQRALELRPRPRQVPQVVQHLPRLLTSVATLGWSGP